METTILKTNLHCNKCVNKIEPLLKEYNAVNNYKFQLDHPDKLVTIEGDNVNIESVISMFKNEGYTASPYKKELKFQFPEAKAVKNNFWKNKNTWKRASFNTLNCLIGCSIGDFGMIIFLQAWYPETSMLWQMILATIAGLLTSIALESTILKVREKFNWQVALKTAFSMSFISMIGMELAMNATDFMITGGKAAFDSLAYWTALVPALLAGFLLPLPYNYYKLEKYGNACH